MRDNLRKVIRSYDGHYQLLKLRDDGSGRWNKYGTKKSLKAISDIEKSGRFVMEIPDDIWEEIRSYRERAEKRKRNYLNKGLTSKII